ncbi:uncharacterized protein LOC120319479 [Crotalus tigris]|uniref:uncharacterized protein LOC120319479 n=1 Tax=Crotalus tigris TaxID=88082 RepID=UPI00192F5B7A|nr:uncharacterized protein LOC120319479 [Crotalus tigris]
MMLAASRRQLQPQPAPEDLSLPEAYQLLAALMQFVGMVLLAVAVYMQHWIWLEPQEFTVGPWPLVFYTFGIPYKIATSRNASDAEYLYFFPKDHHAIKQAMITLCFLNLCFGVLAFLLDYVRFPMLEKYRMRLVPALHIFSGMCTMVLVVMCLWCFEKIRRRFVEPKWWKYAMEIYYGESFYIGLLVLAFGAWAALFILGALRLGSRETPPSKAIGEPGGPVRLSW